MIQGHGNGLLPYLRLSYVVYIRYHALMRILSVVSAIMAERWTFPTLRDHSGGSFPITCTLAQCSCSALAKALADSLPKSRNLFP